MSDLLKIIEQLATDASLVNSTEIESFINNLDIDEALKAKLLTSDIDALKEELQARSKTFCGVLPAEDDEDDQGEDEQGEDQDTESKLVVNL